MPLGQKEKGEEGDTHKPPAVYLATFHAHSQPRPETNLQNDCGCRDSGMKEARRLVAVSRNYTVNTGAEEYTMDASKD